MQPTPGGLGDAQLITCWGGLWHRASKMLISVINLSAKMKLMAPSQPPVPGHTQNLCGREGKADTLKANPVSVSPGAWGG